MFSCIGTSGRGLKALTLLVQLLFAICLRQPVQYKIKISTT